MKKKVKRTKAAATGKPEPLEPPHHKKEANLQPSENENPFDFGGLPDRDLKKNLGCG